LPDKKRKRTKEEKMEEKRRKKIEQRKLEHEQRMKELEAQAPQCSSPEESLDVIDLTMTEEEYRKSFEDCEMDPLDE
jgi:hypothetical protein